MSFRSRGLSAALSFGLVALLGGEARSGMTLEFAITPTTQPLSGSLDKGSDGTIVSTNLAVTSVSSVETAKSVPLSKYLDLQSNGTTGSNFFILNGLVQQYAGTAPAAMTSPANTSTLVANGAGFVFTMLINNGFVSNEIASQFGLTGGIGWSGVLTLNIAAFNSALGSDQITSGTIFLTSPTLVTPPTPAPLGETLTPSVVPEPSSIVMAGMGLILVLGRYRSLVGRSKR